MRARFWLPLLVTAALLLTGCSSDGSEPDTTGPIHEDVVLDRIAFGSCNGQDEPQPLWSNIRRHDPDLWIWLGDNIYADTRDMQTMAQKYAKQRARPEYQKLLATTRVIGTWDDHDYGENDAGRYYPKRDSSQQLFLDFMGVPADHPRREREGVYSAHTYGPPGQRVKVILLDTRYHRDSLAAAPDSSWHYKARASGDFLGATQWAWLENELRTSDAQLHIIGSSIQVIPEQHGWEKWANFPQARQRLFDTIRRSGAPGVILLSGDRHMAEHSRLDPEVIGYPLHEITASGLTHSWGGIGSEPNRHRVDSMFTRINYGFIQIDWAKQPADVTLQVRGRNDRVAIEETISLAELQPD